MARRETGRRHLSQEEVCRMRFMVCIRRKAKEVETEVKVYRAKLAIQRWRYTLMKTSRACPVGSWTPGWLWVLLISSEEEEEESARGDEKGNEVTPSRENGEREGFN
ncbi:hypothetical protein DPEC_G00021450 [Dallia pectoralis]|uniref:Uncharacterized protein n=1 Tax=Dallia pectoralis TaxID=75939 RepID=A0ACC2HGW7_DALPE|nr:hypothetical protein DPEC_G00021450 [Dallia pectoralis]